MRKRDRTAEEKLIDKLTRTGAMLLGTDHRTKAKKVPYPFVMFWSVGEAGDRKGQRCKVIESNMRVADIEFEDGFKTRVNRRAIRRAEV